MSAISVVVGPPAAGKSTYVCENSADDDVIVDYDRIAQAFGAVQSHGSAGSIRMIALAARETAINMITDGEIYADSWVIHTRPSDALILTYEAAGAKFYVLDPGESVCLQRAQDEGRPEAYLSTIRDWYANPPELPDATRVESTKSMKNAAADLSSLPMTAPREVEFRQQIYSGAPDVKSAQTPDSDEHIGKSYLDRAWTAAKKFRAEYPRNAKSDEVVAITRRERAMLRDFPKLALALLSECVEVAGNRRRELEARVDALERGLSYEGTHEIEKQYERNNLLTEGGSLWIAIRATSARPGTSDDWRLCCKRGKDGKDAR